MMRVVIAACWLCACSFHANDATPDGNTPPPIDSTTPIDDPDHDGIDSSVDNCPTVYNPDQADEDHDGIGDACDPCPQDPASTGDRDGDGVGDSCDPHPDTPGDRLSYWNGFDAGHDLPPEWQPLFSATASDWHIDGGALVVDGGDDAPVIRLDAGKAGHTIDIGIDVTSIHDGNSVVSALSNVSTTGELFFHCGVHIDAGVRELWEFNASWLFIDQDTGEPPTQTGSYRAITRVEPGMMFCDTPTASDRHSLQSTTVNDGNTGVGIRVRNLTVAIRYVAVYTR